MPQTFIDIQHLEVTEFGGVTIDHEEYQKIVPIAYHPPAARAPWEEAARPTVTVAILTTQE